jgi:hypothetical protein
MVKCTVCGSSDVRLDREAHDRVYYFCRECGSTFALLKMPTRKRALALAREKFGLIPRFLTGKLKEVRARKAEREYEELKKKWASMGLPPRIKKAPGESMEEFRKRQLAYARAFKKYYELAKRGPPPKPPERPAIERVKELARKKIRKISPLAILEEKRRIKAERLGEEFVPAKIVVKEKMKKFGKGAGKVFLKSIVAGLGILSFLVTRTPFGKIWKSTYQAFAEILIFLAVLLWVFGAGGYLFLVLGFLGALMIFLYAGGAVFSGIMMMILVYLLWFGPVIRITAETVLIPLLILGIFIVGASLWPGKPTELARKSTELVKEKVEKFEEKFFKKLLKKKEEKEEKEER